MGIKRHECVLIRGHVSGATANIPSPRRRAEIEPLKQSVLLTCRYLIRKRKRTCLCNDCPTSSLHMILRGGLDGWSSRKLERDERRSAPCLKLPLERDSERQLAIATGLAIRDASDTPVGFIYIVLFKTIFRDKPHKKISLGCDEPQPLPLAPR